jgi:uncharacterized protein YbcV (DUF1398 family)
MATLKQITDIHDRLGTMDTFYEYIKALSALGVERYETYVSDGRSEYYGDDDKVTSAAQHEPFTISETSNKGMFFEKLGAHLQRKTTPLEMYNGLAESGIEKWIVDIKKMTMTYLDKQGNEILVEAIK